MNTLFQYRCICFLLCLFIVSGNASGQSINSSSGRDPYFLATNDTVSKFGPHCITRNLLQDKKGQYWFATWQGIVRYDGKVFTNVTLQEGLIPFHVFNLFEDNRGNLWFATVRGGLYRYDGKTFRLFTTEDGLPDNTANCIMEDKAGNIWLGTSVGATRYDGKTFTNFTKQDGLTDGWVNDIIQDRKGRLWLGANDGLYVFNGKSFSGFMDKNDSSFKRVWALQEDKDGNIWIGGGIEMHGLRRYDPAASQRTGKKSLTQMLPPTQAVSYLTKDKAGVLWLSVSEPNTHASRDQLAYSQYLCRYDGKTFERIVEKYLPGDSQVFGHIEDSAGNIWFGTMKGPCRYDGKSFVSFSE